MCRWPAGGSTITPPTSTTPRTKVTGGGVYVLSASVTLDTVQLDTNSARKGGAVYAWGGSTFLSYCTIADNTATSGLGPGLCYYRPEPNSPILIVELNDNNPQ